MSRCECKKGFRCAAHDREPGDYEDCPFMADIEEAAYKHFKEIKNGTREPLEARSRKGDKAGD